MGINEFRVALTVDDFERITAFYRDGLGLEPGDLWQDDGQGQIFWPVGPLWRSLIRNTQPASTKSKRRNA